MLALESHWAERHSERFIRRNQWILDHVRPGQRSLDVGAEYGVLVKLLTDHGCFASGIEPHHGKGEAGRRRWGLDIVEGLYSREVFLPGIFDFISAEAVAYYFRPSLKTFIDTAGYHLKPGGLLYLQLAGTENIGLHFFPNFIRCLVPEPNAASVFAPLGWKLVASNTDDFQRGTYGVILQRVPPHAISPKVSRLAAREQLMMSDYNLLPVRNRSKPTPACMLVRTLAALDPSGTLPAFAANTNSH